MKIKNLFLIFNLVLGFQLFTSDTDEEWGNTPEDDAIWQSIPETTSSPTSQLSITPLSSCSSSTSSASISASNSSSSSIAPNCFCISYSNSLKSDEKIIKKVKKLIGQPNDPFELPYLYITILQSNIEKDKKIKALNLLLNDLKDKIDLHSEYSEYTYPSFFLLEFAKDEETFKLLVEAGANVDQVDANGDTLLIRQLKRINEVPTFYPYCLRNLLKFGADPNKSNEITKETFLTVLDKGPDIENTIECVEYKIFCFEEARNIYLDKCNEPKMIKGILESTPLPIELAKMITEYQHFRIRR